MNHNFELTKELNLKTNPLPKSCFSNSMKAIKLLKSGFYIEGFVLDNLGLLCEHSWILDNDKQIIDVSWYSIYSNRYPEETAQNILNNQTRYFEYLSWSYEDLKAKKWLNRRLPLHQLDKNLWRGYNLKQLELLREIYS